MTVYFKRVSLKFTLRLVRIVVHVTLAIVLAPNAQRSSIINAIWFATRAWRDRVGSIRFDLFADDTRKLQQEQRRGLLLQLAGTSINTCHRRHISDACNAASFTVSIAHSRQPDAVIYSSSVRRSVVVR